MQNDLATVNRQMKPLTAIVTVLLLGAGSFNSFGQNGLRANRSAHGKDNGEIIFTDSQSAIMKASMASSDPTVLASGQKLMQPLGVAVSPDGEIVVSDTGCAALLGIDPISGSQRTISCGGALGMPFGIAVEQDGHILVANAASLMRVNPQTGQPTTVSAGQYFMAPIAVAIAENRDIYVADILGQVIRVDPDTGVQTLVTSHGYLMRPQGIAVSGNHIYVTDVATADGNFGIGRVVHINRQTGVQSVLSEGGLLVGPVGVAVDGGTLVVGDPYTINEASANLFDGGIIRVDRATGTQSLIARGSDNHVNPRCVAVIRSAGEQN
jgi:streptogramin lyase